MIKSKGFTLIELMIAMVLGLFVVGVTLSIYVYTAKTSSETVKSARLNHDLELVMNVIVNELRRTGYWGGAIADSNALDNPFMAANTIIQTPNSSCILYSYDADADGTVDDGSNDGINEGVNDTGDQNEYYGFKLDGTTIRMRLSGSTTSDCNDGNWGTGELVDGEEVVITNLTFQFQNSCLNVPVAAASYALGSCSGFGASGEDIVERRKVNISITGQLADDAFVTKTLNDQVTVRNDYIFQIP